MSYFTVVTEDAALMERLHAKMMSGGLIQLEGVSFMPMQQNIENCKKLTMTAKSVEYVSVPASTGRTSPTWTGEGLPPAGAEFERRFIDQEDSSWAWGKVIAHGKRRIFYVDRTGEEWSHSPEDMGFRPIRTPEQIAADNRLHLIRNACSLINPHVESYNVNIDCSAAMRAVIEAVIDAGYRKP